MGVDVSAPRSTLPGVEIREATLSDIIFVADHLRKPDHDEHMAVMGPEDPAVTFVTGLLMGPAYVALMDDVPFLALGVTRETDDLGWVWLVGTDTLDTVPRSFVRHSRGFLEFLQGDFKTLKCIVHPRNDKHLQWLEWLGFRVTNVLKNFGKSQTTFYEYTKE